MICPSVSAGETAEGAAGSAVMTMKMGHPASSQPARAIWAMGSSGVPSNAISARAPLSRR